MALLPPEFSLRPSHPELRSLRQRREEEALGTRHRPSLICLPGNLPVYLYLRLLFIYLSVYLSVCLFIYHLSLLCVRASHGFTLLLTFQQNPNMAAASTGSFLLPAIGKTPPVFLILATGPWGLVRGR